MVESVSRTVTIVFTDLVGSTELTASLGPRAADDLRRRHFSSLEAAVRDTGGDVVKNLGDGLMVAYESAAGAVAGAVAMQEAVDRNNRRPRSPHLDIRVGISLGEATSEGGDWFGPPVVEAARLCAGAEGGQILTTDVVRTLVGPRSDAGFKPLGVRDLKGLPEPTPVCEITWERRRPDEAGLPPALADRTTAFVGRSNEMEQLRTEWDRARGGERRILLFAGEPGIGKTRIVAEAARHAHSTGGTVLYGRSYEETLTPYQPFVEALRHHGYDLAGLVPAESKPAGVSFAPSMQGGIDGDRYLLFEAVVSLLAELGLSAPILLALDDLHWADKPSLLLLQYLARSATPLPLLLVGTYRETDLGRDHPLSGMLGDLRRERACTRIHLHGLDHAELSALVADRAGHEAPPEFVHALRGETEGNPFFAEEVLIHLAESGAIYQRDGRWVSDVSTMEELGIPEGVRDVIGRRLSHLSENGNRVLGVAAVLGREFSVRVVERVGGLTGDETLDALEEAAARQLVAEVPGDPDGYTFTHALIRQTLYEETSAARRLRLHQRAGEALEDLHREDQSPHLGELAYHFSQLAYGGDVDKALEYCVRAARHSSEVMAYEDAVVHYRRALQVLEVADRTGGVEELDLRIELAPALLNAIETTDAEREAKTAIALARSLGDDARLVRAASVLPLGMGSGASYVPTIEDALDKAGPEPTRERARLLSLLSYFSGFDPDASEARRDAATEEAVRVAYEVGHPEDISIALMNRWFTLFQSPDLDDLRAIVPRLAEVVRDVPARRYVVHFQAESSIFLREGDIEGARGMLEAVERDGDARYKIAEQAATGRLSATLALLEGKVEEAERLATDAYLVWRAAGSAFATAMFGLQLFAIRREQGRLAEMEGPLRALLDRVDDQPFQGPAIRAGLALLLLEEDRLDEAAHELVTIVSGSAYTRREAAPITWANLAEVGCAVGDGRLCTEMYERLLPWDGQCVVVGGNPYVNGAVSRYLGLCRSALGEFDAAIEHFEASLAMTEHMGAAPWIARTRLDWARALRGRDADGDADAAADHARAALEIAEDLALPKLAENARPLVTRP